MRIGVNALYLIPGGVGGTEIYLRSLLTALAAIDGDNEYMVYTNRETAGTGLVPPSPRFRDVPQSVSARNRPARIVYEQTALAVRARVDVVFNPGFTAPVACPAPQVTVFHDLQHKRHPEHFRRFDLPAWRLLLWASAHRSRRIVAVSEATRADLLRYYSIPAGRVCVIPHGVDPVFPRIAAERRRDGFTPDLMLLCVSTLHPHKNLERLIRVFARYHARHPGWTLTLAGLRGFHAGPVERAVAEAKLGAAVRITGWIPREELYGLFRRAAAFVYPSTFEGYGMPVSEALAAGLPTACSDIEPLRTVAGGAAWLFPPDDEDAMLDAIGKAASGRAAGAWPEPPSWEDAARATLTVLRAACSAAGS